MKKLILYALALCLLVSCGSGTIETENHTSATPPTDWYGIVKDAQPYNLGQTASWGEPTWNGSYWQVFASWTTGSGTWADPAVHHAGAAVSSDGITWRFTELTNYYYGASAVWARGKWWVVADYNVMNSDDGMTWTIVANPSGTRYQSLLQLVWTGNYFITFENRGAYYYTSEDGLSWTRRTSPIANQYWHVIWNGSILVAIPEFGGQGSNITNIVSSDGASWVFGNIGNVPELGDNLWSIAWNGSVFFISGNSGRTATSADGVNWTYRNISGLPAQIKAIGSTFIGVSGSSLATSQDGINWDMQTLPFINRYNITANGHQLLLTGSNTPYVYTVNY